MATGSGPGPALVRRLLRAQFPQWAELAVQAVGSSGTDNAIFRLGAHLAVRLPLLRRSVEQVEKEQRWLPRLAPLLPLAIPVPVAQGVPGEGYAWPWSVYRWLDGEPATHARVADLRQAAVDRARFVAALQRIDFAGGPPTGPDGSRGRPLAVLDREVSRAIGAVHDLYGSSALTAAWDAARRLPAWQGRPVWIHADLHGANLLVRQGRIRAVIDFGLLGVGDPACDLTVAWSVLSAETRDAFRSALPVDDVTWARGRGWALAWALIALAYYRHRGHALADISRRTIERALPTTRPAHDPACRQGRFGRAADGQRQDGSAPVRDRLGPARGHDRRARRGPSAGQARTLLRHVRMGRQAAVSFCGDKTGAATITLTGAPGCGQPGNRP